MARLMSEPVEDESVKKPAVAPEPAVAQVTYHHADCADNTAHGALHAAVAASCDTLDEARKASMFIRNASSEYEALYNKPPKRSS